MTSSIFKKMSLFLTCLLCVGGSIAVASAFNVDKPFEEAHADDAIEFIYRYWNEGKKEVVSVPSTCLTYTTVTSSTTTWTDDNWYVVNGEDVTITGSITVTGNVHLILCDGWTLTVDGRIYVPYGNTINIYSQSDGVNQGRLIAGSSDSGTGAGIGGNYNNGNDIAGTINIHGGTISARGGSYSAGIGGSAGFHSSPRRANAGTVNIYGGNITATGRGAAGIGGGNEGAGGTVVICGGTVTATGGTYGAGIGGGEGQNGGTIIISGGNVTASGATYSAGIGGGGDGGSCGSITISGGTVTATGGNHGAGIGGGDGGSGGSITISGGMVTANGGFHAKGIGAGEDGSSNGTLNAINGCFVFGSDDHAIDLNNIDLDDKQDDYSNTRWQYMGVKVMHVHNFTSYSASGNTVTATCDNADGNCLLPNHQATLTISAPSGSLIYDGTAKEATYVDTSSGAAFSNITISYTKGGEAIVGSPIDAGTYVATISFDEDATKTASIEYTISKAASSLDSNPAGVAGLIYTGNAQELITAGTTSGGELKYSLDGINYSSYIPTGTNAGDYTVYYKVFGDSNHNDSEEQNLVVSISKATIDPVGELNATYGDTLADVTLPAGWAWDDATQSVGNAGNQSFNATFAEQPNYNEAHQAVTINVATVDPDPVGELNATYGDTLADVTLPAGWAWDDATQSVGNVGSHDFAAHYTAVDTNHHDKDASITVSVSQATPTDYDIPTGLEAVYGDKLSSVALPEHWSWKNPNDLVGNAGNQNHIAIYTPEDPNYKAVEENVTISVSKANPTYVVPSTIDAPYNVELSTLGLPEGFSWMDGSQKTSTWGENTFKAKYTPSDTVNYNIVENIDIKVNVKWILVDPTEGDVSVTINDGDAEYNVDISVKVEIKTEISTEQKRTNYADIGKEFIKKNEDIGAIYSVKLIRTVGGVEEEIQPSDIKPGTKVTISMVLPDELVGKDFRLLHIHNSHDVEEISNSKYGISGDGKTVILQTERLSEFAFIIAAEGDNGFDYSTGLPGWAIALIIVGSILLLCLLCFFLLFFVFNKWIKKDDKAIRAVKFGKKDNKVRLLVMPFRFEYREEAEVFDTKQEALKE